MGQRYYVTEGNILIDNYFFLSTIIKKNLGKPHKTISKQKLLHVTLRSGIWHYLLSKFLMAKPFNHTDTEPSTSLVPGVPLSQHPGHRKDCQEKHSRIKSREGKLANPRLLPFALLPQDALPCCPHSPGFSKSFHFCFSSYGPLPTRGLPQGLILNSATEPTGQRQEKEESQTERLRKDGIFNRSWAGESSPLPTIPSGTSCLPSDRTHPLQNSRLP